MLFRSMLSLMNRALTYKPKLISFVNVDIIKEATRFEILQTKKFYQEYFAECINGSTEAKCVRKTCGLIFYQLQFL